LARALSDESVDPLTLALAGGEDFELLFTIDPRVVQEIRSTLRDDELDVTRIGSVTAGSARIGGRDLSRWEELGWDHLRARRDC
jgi:thiamine monophosphate kinase